MDLVYLAATDQMFATVLTEPQSYNGTSGYSLCANRDLIACNWLSEPSSPDGLCQSCCHTIKIPDISNLKNREKWSRLERAKRRLFYSLIKSGLRLDNKVSDVEGTLRFELLGDEFHPDGKKKRIMTGHDNGLITINIAEADDAIRERNRTMMGEPYRTLIGHFRHEIGHYYWDRLVTQPSVIDRFRHVFGDERRDYSQALATYYANGPLDDWQSSYVSAYSSAHPWEDFAETWAHYFHMVGGLETAYAYGLNPQPMEHNIAPLVQLIDPYSVHEYEQLLSHWVPITVAMNAMNRSIGHSDYYPFALSPYVSQKLSFIHDLIKGR